MTGLRRRAETLVLRAVTSCLGRAVPGLDQGASTTGDGRSPCVEAALVVFFGMLGLATLIPVHAQERSAAITVSVHDPAGRPVPGVELLVSGADWHADTTDANGQARFRVVPGVWEIAPSHGDLAVLPTDRSVLVRSGESRNLEFQTLPKTGVVRGRVASRSPQPSALTGPLTAAAYAVGREGGSLPVSATRLSEEQAFHLPVPPGRWRVRLLEVGGEDDGREALVEAGREVDLEIGVDFQELTGATGLVFEAGLITERIGPAFSMTTVGLYTLGSGGRHRIVAHTQARADQTYAVLSPVPGGGPAYAFAWRPGGAAVPPIAFRSVRGWSPLPTSDSSSLRHCRRIGCGRRIQARPGRVGRSGLGGSLRGLDDVGAARQGAGRPIPDQGSTRARVGTRLA